jgi:hypothetical protein
MPILLSYADVREELETGDIVLFSGSGPYSRIIQAATHSRWSHVGMVYCLPPDCIFLWESVVTSTWKDFFRGKGLKGGVRMSLLSDRLRDYRGCEVAVRRLLKYPRGPATYHNLALFRRAIKDAPYERHVPELLKSVYDGPWGRNHEDLSDFFCSELMAETYQNLGLLTEEQPSNEYTPADFSAARKLDLKSPAVLDDEMFIDTNAAII